MKKTHLVFNDEQKGLKQSFSMAFQDITMGIGSVSLWSMLGWQDIRQRYRRSVIGPFWLTITTAIFVCALGFLYSELFKQTVAEYLPYVAIGFVVWSFVSSILTDSCTVFVESESMIKQVRQPFSMYVMRMIWRNTIVFLHNAIILVIIIFVLPAPSIIDLLTIPVAVLLLGINGLWLGLLFGILCVRYRDIIPMIGSIVQITFFLTPIFWKPEVLSSRSWFVELNPAHHFINIIRAPMLGEGIPVESWLATAGIAAVGLLLAVLVLAGFRHRIAYWVG